jgi:hypothetical protein
MSTLGIIGLVAGLITIVSGCSGLWKKTVTPKLISSKLKKLYALVEDWFNEIDRSNITELSMTLLNNKENNLKNYRLNFSLDFRKRFLRFCGIKKELQDSEEFFEKYSRCPAEGIDIWTFWHSLLGDFYEFKRLYEQKDPKTNFANVEMRIKLLKKYVGYKIT